MTVWIILLWLINVGLDTLGQTAFKYAAMQPNQVNGWVYWFNLFTNYWVWLGIGSYLLQFLLWLAFVSLVPLSVAILMASANMITVMLVGRWLFAEPLTSLRIMGIGLITLGVIMVGFG
ncbi:hypothetical protein RHO15_04240 [Utexia brackfieldae]|uniref:hypothetical protein n=1 Tax=Utexia brackfieldae TaxID=3074108 RepID=UPI00370D6998